MKSHSVLAFLFLFATGLTGCAPSSEPTSESKKDSKNEEPKGVGRVLDQAKKNDAVSKSRADETNDASSN